LIWGTLLFALGASAAPVIAQAATAAVTSYPASFFAAEQPVTALDMLKLVPGFVFDGGGQVRGFGGAAGNVLIDGGRPASKDDGLDEILKRIPAGSVLRIEVIRGGAPGVDMQGKTVLANVIRRTGPGARLTVSASTTARDDGRVATGFRAEGAINTGKTSWEGSLLIGRGFDDGSGAGLRTTTSATGDVTTRANESALGVGENYKATGAVETPILGGKLRLNASVFLNPYRYTQADALIDPAGLDLETDHSNQDTAEIGLRYDHPLGSKAQVESFFLQQFGQNRYTAQYQPPADLELFKLAKQTSETITRTTVNVQTSSNLSFQVGAEGDFNWLLDHTRYVVNGVDTSLPAANVRVTELRGETFGTATWKATKTVTIEAGLRVEASRIASTGDVVQGRAFFFPKPRLSVTWSPDEADQFRLRAEREVGQLDFDDFAAGAASLTNGEVHAGNPALTPQQAWVYEVAYDRRFWGGGEISASLKHYQLSDIIDRAPIYDPSGTYDAPGNIGGGTKDEAMILLTLPTDRLGLKNGALTVRETFRESRVTDPTTGVARSISGVHPQGGEIHFTQGLPRWKATWGFDIYNQFRETYYRFNEIDTDKLKTYAVLFAEYRPKSDLTVRFEVQNLGGRSFRHVREVYDGPRDSNPPDYIDIRDLHGSRGFYLRIRETFG
jgi:outer membrane receptor protein involved in Fe transport